VPLAMYSLRYGFGASLSIGGMSSLSLTPSNSR
jgi:hypothetical protein